MRAAKAAILRPATKPAPFPADSDTTVTADDDSERRTVTLGDASEQPEQLIDTRDWVMSGETIADNADEYALQAFVRHDDLPEIITAYLAANRPATNGDAKPAVHGWNRPLVSEEDHVPCRVNDDTCAGQITADRYCDVHRPAAYGDLIERAARCMAERFFAVAHRWPTRWEDMEEPIKANNRLRAAALVAAGLLADGHDQARDENGFTFAEHKRFNWALINQHDEKERALVDELRGVREIVRDLMAKREQDRARIEKVLALHSEFKIYDECGHRHEMPEGHELPEGLHLIEEVGLVCEDGYQYSICRECCADDTYQTEACATDHEHTGPGACWPCPTRAALTAPTEETSEECTDVRCARLDGRCVGMHCTKCGEPCGPQGHVGCKDHEEQPDAQ